DERDRLVLSNLETGTPAQGPGHTMHLRMTISEITGDGFKIEKEVSMDGGKEWFLAAKATYHRGNS
ncbi:MAG TPA: hypothetical protein VFG76_06600, partial [Candidatus Polarisedimenticolia bacterium]|nr:hypothetical protein [Candidatus Polarisedimenticolia bacterium]